MEPKPGVLTISKLRNLDNWRAFIHQLAPVIVTVLTALSITTEDQAALWVALAFAILDPLLSYSNATDKARRIAYGVLGLASSGGLLTALLVPTAPEILPVASALTTIVSSFLGRFYTPTSTMVPAGTLTYSDQPRRTAWPTG
jgi:hypothetical protein